ncbi:pseudouridine synthase, partial [Myriangium duriaei CBS 260.36]
FDRSRYSTRYIALKFAYLGQRYNGLEYVANNPTPLPTVEEELWKALAKTRLIFPTGEAAERGEVSWEGCEYSKCGRTDKGVSAFGQVVALRVRSARPVPGLAPKKKVVEDEREGEDQHEEAEVLEEKEFDPIRDELPYIQLLNRVLPHDIRALAWCPDPPEGFSARFSCEERRYRYFFTNPAFAPVPGARGLQRTVDGKPLREGWLDIEVMQDAAKRLEGLHDFRNFCKVDPAKQITNHERRIFHASIEEIDMRRHPVGYTPKLYSFNVNGSAFLWHQVRNMVAVIFLVGQGLESPSVVSDLLDPKKAPTRPKYEMASDAPLVLWDCIFPKKGDPERKDALNWVRVGDEGGRDSSKQADVDGGDGKFGRNGIMDSLWTTWRQRKIDEVLAGSLVDLVATQGRQTSLPARDGAEMRRSTRIFEGANTARAIGRYIPVMQKERMDHFSVINARYLEKKAL